MRKEPNRNVYVGHRYVPLILEEWDKKYEYEGLSVVTYKGASYTSKKRVPVGIDILNKEFWSLTGNYNAQVEYYRDETEKVSQKLDSKSDLEYVDNELGKKANKNYVDTELSKKSNKTYVDTELGKKSDITYVDKEIKKINDRYVRFEDFGAVGDGVTDDTEAIQNALDYHSKHGLKIIGQTGSKYLISKTGSVTYDTGATVNNCSYCLLIGNNVDIDFNGSQLIQNNEDYGCFIINKGVLNKPKTYNDNIRISNFSFIGNADRTTIKSDENSPALNLVKVRNLHVNNAYFEDVYDCGFSILASENVNIDEIEAFNIKGNGVYLGTENLSGYEDLGVENANIGVIKCTDIKEGTPGRSANPFIGCLQDSYINSIIVKNSFWGIKIHNETDTLNIGSVLFDGGQLTQTNSGLRIQGKSDNNPLKNVNVGNVISKNCGGSGLYIQFSKNVNVENYIGINNGKLGYTDVWIHKDDIQINIIKIDNAHSGGVQLREGSNNVRINNIIANNIKDTLISDASDNAFIGNVTLKNNLPYYQTTYLYTSNKTDNNTIIDLIRVLSVYSNNYISIFSKYTRIKKLELSRKTLTEFETTLSEGLRTEIFNENIIYMSNGGGSFVQPVVEITQLSGDPVNITNQNFVTGGYRLTHENALGDERIRVKIRDYHI